MNDMSSVIVPKSDQINAEDFIPGPATFTIEGVSISPGTEQPVSIKLVGEQRVYRPCKSMSRVLVQAWGPDARRYVGRSLTLYRDPKVKWGGMEVGGIRISHLSHIDGQMTLALTATKGKRAPHIVKPLPGNGAGSAGAATERPTPSSEDGPGETDYRNLLPELETAASKGTNQLRVAWEALQPEARKALAGELPELKRKATEADPPPEPGPAGDEPTGDYDGV